ncbi:lipoprotein [Streptosporangium fragile]|uniref:Lipoprotein n=1 Tax=Streptosporangium fragile TaxID=46186 RepID=A0ABN3WD71_9ACTN
MKRLRYRFDTLIARGSTAMFGLLLVVTLITAVAGAVAVLSFSSRSVDLRSALWSGLMRMMSPAMVTRDTGSPVFLGSMLVLALTGIVIFSALIGMIETALDRKLATLRKGRSLVVERGHTVVLGWSEQVFLVLAELSAADANRGATCVAILAEKDRVAMEEEIRNRLVLPRRLRVVCRTGSPTDPIDVAIVSPERAKAVIVLGTEDGDSDARTVKSLLALDAAGVPPAVHVVAGVRDPRNLAAARLAGGSGAQVVDVDEISARIMVQTCVQAGLSAVYSDLLAFDGDEIYFTGAGELAGERFGDALPTLENCSLIGLERGGRILLSPAAETRIGADDRLIVISNDDGAAPARSTAAVDEAAISTASGRGPVPRRVLVLGWNDRGAAVVAEFNRYLPHGSHVAVAADDPRMIAELGALGSRTAVLPLACRTGDVTLRATLESLDPGTFDHVLILADDRVDPQLADSRTLLTLLHVRDMRRSHGWGHSLVTEIVRDCDRRLVEVTEVDDFIVSSKITTLLMAQLAEDPRRRELFADLFDAKGHEIYIKPAADYVRLATPVTYATVVAAACSYGEAAIGYRTGRAADGEGPGGNGVVLNPPKSSTLTFRPGDTVIVLARS